jgi:hypothetical protein
MAAWVVSSLLRKEELVPQSSHGCEHPSLLHERGSKRRIKARSNLQEIPREFEDFSGGAQTGALLQTCSLYRRFGYRDGYLKPRDRCRLALPGIPSIRELSAVLP